MCVDAESLKPPSNFYMLEHESLRFLLVLKIIYLITERFIERKLDKEIMLCACKNTYTLLNWVWWHTALTPVLWKQRQPQTDLSLRPAWST